MVAFPPDWVYRFYVHPEHYSMLRGLAALWCHFVYPDTPEDVTENCDWAVDNFDIDSAIAQSLFSVLAVLIIKILHLTTLASIFRD